MIRMSPSLFLKIGEPMPLPVPTPDQPEELLTALNREAKQYETTPKRWTTPETIDREFGYHKATEKTGPVHDLVRALLRQLAHELNDLLPECPRKTEAIGHLRTAMWAANSAVAAYGSDSPTWVPTVRPHLAPSTWHLGEAETVPDPEGEAKLAYKAYGSVTGWRNYRGEPMPAWENLGDKIRQAWQMAAATSFARGRDSAAADFQKPNRPTDEQAAEAIFVAIGEASTCWESLDRTGVFQSMRAASIGRRLLGALGFGIPEQYAAISAESGAEMAAARAAGILVIERTDMDPESLRGAVTEPYWRPGPEAGERESSEPE